MPIRKCQANKKSGYKYGDTGKCYAGSEAKDKSDKQGKAIEVNKKRGK